MVHGPMAWCQHRNDHVGALLVVQTDSNRNDIELDAYGSNLLGRVERYGNKVATARQ